MSESDLGAVLEGCLKRANEGDDEARQRLLMLAHERLLALSRKLKRGFPRVGRWEQTEDVCQQASLKLYEALKQTTVTDSRHFFRLAAKKIRETLIDMARHDQGALGVGSHHATQVVRNDGDDGGLAPHELAGEMTQNPQHLAQWGIGVYTSPEIW